MASKCLCLVAWHCERVEDVYYVILLPICTVATAVKAMCHYCSIVTVCHSNPQCHYISAHCYQYVRQPQLSKPCATIAVQLLYAIPILTVTISVHTVTNMYGSCTISRTLILAAFTSPFFKFIRLLFPLCSPLFMFSSLYFPFVHFLFLISSSSCNIFEATFLLHLQTAASSAAEIYDFHPLWKVHFFSSLGSRKN